MKKKFLRLSMCALAAGTIVCSSLIISQKYVQGTENKSIVKEADETSVDSLSNCTHNKYEQTAVSNELDDFYISEINYKDDMNNSVIPYINSRMKSGYIDGVDDVQLYYEMYTTDTPKANIVIAHGFSESVDKYKEIIYYFLKSGYNVFGIDHRGHGRSGSLGIADKSQIHVESFYDYIKDFKHFINEIVLPNSDGQDLMLFAHSMGGGIGSRFLEVYPEYFSKAILNTPMMEVHTGNFPEFIAKAIVNTTVSFGQSEKYVLGQEAFKPSYSFEPISTSCENRWTYINDIINNDEVFQRGGASYKWTQESFNMTKEITKPENASKVKIPVLLFQAGDDVYVKPDGQNRFAENAENCTLVRIENAKHEIYFERDEIQKPYLEQVLRFYNEQQ